MNIIKLLNNKILKRSIVGCLALILIATGVIITRPKQTAAATTSTKTMYKWTKVTSASQLAVKQYTNIILARNGYITIGHHFDKSEDSHPHYKDTMKMYYFGMQSAPEELQLGESLFYTENAYDWWQAVRYDGENIDFWVPSIQHWVVSREHSDSTLDYGSFSQARHTWTYSVQSGGTWAFQHYDDSGYDEYIGLYGWRMFAENMSTDKGWSDLHQFTMYRIDAETFTCLSDPNYIVQSGQELHIGNNWLMPIGASITIEPGGILYIDDEATFICNGIIRNYGTVIVGEKSTVMSAMVPKDESTWHGFSCGTFVNYGGGYHCTCQQDKKARQGEGIFIIKKDGFVMSSVYGNYFTLYGSSTFVNYGTAIFQWGINCGDYEKPNQNATIINEGNIGMGYATNPSSGGFSKPTVTFTANGYTLSSGSNYTYSPRVGNKNGTSAFRYVNTGTVRACGCNTATSTLFNGANGMIQKKAENYPSGDVSNVYALSIGTGPQTPGTDVVYLGVRYVGEDKVERTEYLMTYSGALKKSYERAEKISGRTSELNRKQNMLKNYDVSMTLASTDTCFAVSSGEDYFFKTTVPVKEFLGFDILTGGSDWDCRYLALYEVTEVNGPDMKGYLSSEAYIDYAGKRVFLWEKEMNGPNISKEQLYSIRVPFKKDTASSSRAWTTTEGTADSEGNKKFGMAMGSASGYITVTKEPYYKEKTDKQALLINLSSVAGSGVDGFVQSYNSCVSLNGTKKKNSSGATVTNSSTTDYGIGRYKECMLLQVSYTNIYNVKQSYFVPILYSTMCYLCNEKNFGDKYIYGLAQAGDSLAFQFTFPECNSTVELSLYYGTDVAETAGGIAYGKSKTHIKVDENGFIGLTGVQLYDSEHMPNYTVDTNTYRLIVSTNGLPQYYYTSSTKVGNQIAYSNEGTSKLELKSLLQEYNRSAKTQPSLTPRSTGDLYLVEVDTSYPTMNRATFTFGYTQQDGKSATTSTYVIQDEVEAYYGLWTALNGGAYELTAVPGGTLRFIIEAKAAIKFEYAIVRVEGVKGEADFQLDNIKISSLASGSTSAGDVAYKFDLNKEIKANGATTYWQIDRTVSTDTLFVDYGFVTLICSGSQTQISFSEYAKEIVNEVDVNWDDYKNYMSYSSTDQYMGYVKPRCTYTVTVKVAADKDGASSDSGSKNQFYFQLYFSDNETTGYVLANQQLMGDGFRSGCEESFKIFSNYDHGDVVAVNIIPDDQQEGSDVYDKLCVETITISKETNAGIARTWRCDVNDWIGIDYTDSAAQGTLSGQSGRREEEMRRSFVVNKKGYDILLVFEIETGDYKFTDVSTRREQEGLPIQCALKYEVAYTNQMGAYCLAEGDAAAAMYEYMDYQAKISTREDTYKDDIFIDSHNMLKPVSVNRFIVPLDNPMTINSIRLIAYGDQKAAYHWKLGKVKVYRITGGTGALYIDGTGAYSRRYDMTQLAESTNQTYVYTLIGADNINHASKVDFKLDDNNVISVDSDTGKWNSIVGKEPDSANDKLDIFVHTTGDGKPITQYDMQMKISYVYNTKTNNNLIATKPVDQMRRGGSNIFYTSVDASGFQSLNSISLIPIKLNGTKALEENEAQVYVDYVTIVQEGSGVIKKVLYVDIDEETNLTSLPNSANNFGNASTTHPKGNTYSQQITLEIGDLSGGEVALSRDEQTDSYNDIGIAIKYTLADDPTHREYRSPNFFLSELVSGEDGDGILKPHQRIVIDAAQMNLETVKGVRAFAQGDLTINDTVNNVDNRVSLEGFMLTTTATENGRTTRTSYVGDDLAGEGQCILDGDEKPLGLNQVHDIGFTDITFKTMANTVARSMGCSDSIWARILWITENGTLKSMDIDDLKSYVQEGSFAAGATATISVPLYDFYKLHAIMLEPYNTDATSATWGLDTIDVSVHKKDNVNETSDTKLVSRLLTEAEGDITDNSQRGDYATTINMSTVNFAGLLGWKHLDLSTVITETGIRSKIAEKVGPYSEKMEYFTSLYQTAMADSTRNRIYTNRIPSTVDTEAGYDATVWANCGDEITFTAVVDNSDGLVSDEDKFIKGSFKDVDLHIYSVSSEDATLTTDITENLSKNGKLMLGYSNGSPMTGTLKSIRFVADNDSGEKIQKYVIELVSCEFPDKKIRILVKADINVMEYFNSFSSYNVDAEVQPEQETPALVVTGTDEDTPGTEGEGTSGTEAGGTSDTEGTGTEATAGS